MPTLVQSLQGRDIGFLRIIAELWGVEFKAPDAHIGIQRLTPLLLEPEFVTEMLGTLPEPARMALLELLDREGRIPWAEFTRRFGSLRDRGPAWRDRERPYLNGRSSAVEALWYRGLIYRQFFDTSDGPEEFAYIPDDLLAALPQPAETLTDRLGRRATPAEKQYLLLASDRILDDAATLLAVLRLNPAAGEDQLSSLPPGLLADRDSTYYTLEPPVLIELLSAAGLIDEHGAPLPEPTRRFLEAERGEALAILARGWLRSVTFNELRLLPGLAAEGSWTNDPVKTRQSVLDFLSTVPGWLTIHNTPEERPFWSLGAFVSAIRQDYPDFQRPAGDYDSYYLKDVQSGQYLRGFAHWEAVDGELVRFVVAGVLFWLGVMDLAFPSPPENGSLPAPSGFRFSGWASALLNLKAPGGLPEETEKLIAGVNGKLHIPRLAPRSARYHVARFARYERFTRDVYHYRITPESLSTARKQGLQVSQLLTILKRYAQGAPPALYQALDRWEAQGSQARIEQLTILRVKDPAILQALNASRASRFLGDILGPTVVAVKPGAVDKVLDALAELGYLGEVDLD